MTDREYLFSLEQIGIKLGLEQIRALLDALDHPEHAFRSIVVAGTNGKGSVSAMIERGLRAAGYRTGRYTSPHLTRIEERIAVDGLPVAHDTFDRLAARVRSASRQLPHPPSFFEATTALALEAFRDAAVDVAVLEVGLGGRLDATNAVTPVLSVITAIDLDHQTYLGDTIELIAAEKAGIIKPGVPVVIGNNTPEALAVIRAVAARRGADLQYAPDGVTASGTMNDGLTRLSLSTPTRTWPTLTLGLRGRHQIDNAITATRALEALDARGLISIRPDAIATALTDVMWPARLEMRRWRASDTATSIGVLIDGAHNPAGARALSEYLQEAYGRRLPFVVAAMGDKDIAGILEALAPTASTFICTRPNTPRASQPSAIAAVARNLTQIPVREAESPGDALAMAAASGEPVVVAGSLYLAGEIRELLS